MCTPCSAHELQFPHLLQGVRRKPSRKDAFYAPAWLISRETLSVTPAYLNTSPKLCRAQITTAKAIPWVQDGLLSNLVMLRMGLTLLAVHCS